MLKKILIFATMLLTLSIPVFLIVTNLSTAQNSNQDLILKVESDQKNYLMGEVIKLEVSLTNNLTETVRIPSVENGYLHIWIASSDLKFKKYRGSQWGFRDSGPGVKAGETYKSKVTVLWNSMPALIQKENHKRLNSHFAFSTPGIYFIKTTGTAFYNGGQIKIESEPIQIVIDEPVGDDLKVWNKIKSDPELAYFMQESSFHTLETDKKEKLTRDIKQIASDYPNSKLANNLKESFKKFEQKEEKKKIVTKIIN